MGRERDIRIIRNTLLVFLAIVMVALLKLLSSLLIPLALAIFIAMLLHPVLSWFERKRVPFLLSLGIIMIVSTGMGALFWLLVIKTGQDVYTEKDRLIYQVTDRLGWVVAWLNNSFDLHIDLATVMKNITDRFSLDFFLRSSGNLATSIGNISTIFLFTTIYLLILLGGILRYEHYLNYVESGGEQPGRLLQAFEQVKRSIVTYIKVKFFTSLCTGLGFMVVCFAFKIDFAVFWGFLAFVLNFIPTVGSIVATIPPFLMGVVLIDHIAVVLIFLLLLTVVQFFFGTIIEPIFLGSNLELNTIAVIMGLIFWGYVWGVIGMLLSVPMMVLIRVLLSQVEDAQVLVRLMGAGAIRIKDRKDD